MEKDLVNKIIDKKYIQLSEDELNEIQPYCESEDEFNQMKEVFTQVAAVNFIVPTPKKETKQSLDALFDEKFVKANPVWYMSVMTTLIPKEKPFYRQPLAQVAAVCLLLLLAVPFFQNDIAITQKEQIAKIEEKKNVETAPMVPSISAEKSIEVSQDSEMKELNNSRTEPGLVATTIQLKDESATGSLEDDAFGNGFAFSETTITGNESNFVHSDLIASVAEENVDYSITAADVPNVLDLLTATF